MVCRRSGLASHFDNDVVGAPVEQDEALNAAGSDLNLEISGGRYRHGHQARQARFEGFIDGFWNVEHRDVGLVGQHLP